MDEIKNIIEGRTARGYDSIETIQDDTAPNASTNAPVAGKTSKIVVLGGLLVLCFGSAFHFSNKYGTVSSPTIALEASNQVEVFSTNTDFSNGEGVESNASLETLSFLEDGPKIQSFFFSHQCGVNAGSMTFSRPVDIENPLSSADVGISSGSPVSDFLCGDRTGTARDTAFGIVDTVLGAALDGKNLPWTLGTIVVGQPVAASLILIGATAAWTLACTNDKNEFSVDQQIKMIEAIAKEAAQKALRDRDAEEMKNRGESLKALVANENPPAIYDIGKMAYDYYSTADLSAELGFQAADLASNAAAMTVILLEGLKEEFKSKGKTSCCQEVKSSFERVKKEFAENYEKMRASFRAYKNSVLDTNHFDIKQRNQWYCGSLLISYANQYCGQPRSPSMKHLPVSWCNERGPYGWCHGNSAQKDRVKQNLRPKAESYVNDLENKIFTDDMRSFYKRLSDLEFSCE